MNSSSGFSPKLIVLLVFFALLFFVIKLSAPPSEPRMPGAVPAPQLELPRKAAPTAVPEDPVPEVPVEGATQAAPQSETPPPEESWD